jgi:hypothetical protein
MMGWVESHCTFRCQRCFASGNRAMSIKLKPGRVPCFDDVCPDCHSYDVEVIAPGWDVAGGDGRLAIA